MTPHDQHGDVLGAIVSVGETPGLENVTGNYNQKGQIGFFI